MDEKSLIWLRAAYALHSFSCRDPRCPSSAAMSLPVASPTAVLLGICSTLFEFGREQQALAVLDVLDRFDVRVDAPDGIVFFRAFHQLRRYVRTTSKGKKQNEADAAPLRIGFTDIAQGTREYGIPEGPMTFYVGTPPPVQEAVTFALRNRDHIGTHDSLCSLIGDVEVVGQLRDVLFEPVDGSQISIPPGEPLSVVTLSRFRSKSFEESPSHWKLSGGKNTEHISYIIKGGFKGTTTGKLYSKSGFATVRA